MQISKCACASVMKPASQKGRASSAGDVRAERCPGGGPGRLAPASGFFIPIATQCNRVFAALAKIQERRGH
eukprot:8879841-Pyramimonas_sp.AAC.1